MQEMKSNQNPKEYLNTQLCQVKERMKEQNSEQQRRVMLHYTSPQNALDLSKLKKEIPERNICSIKKVKEVYVELIKQARRTIPILHQFNVKVIIIKQQQEKNPIKIFLEVYLMERSIRNLMCIEKLRLKSEMKKKKRQQVINQDKMIKQQQIKKQASQVQQVQQNIDQERRRQLDQQNNKIKRFLLRKNHVQNMNKTISQYINKWQSKNSHKDTKEQEQKALIKVQEMFQAKIKVREKDIQEKKRPFRENQDKRESTHFHIFNSLLEEQEKTLNYICQKSDDKNNHNLKVINENQQQGMVNIQQRDFFGQVSKYSDEKILQQDGNQNLLSEHKVQNIINYQNINFYQQLQRRTFSQIKQLIKEFQKDHSELKNIIFNLLRKAKQMKVPLIKQEDIHVIYYKRENDHRERRICTCEESINYNMRLLKYKNNKHRENQRRQEQQPLLKRLNYANQQNKKANLIKIIRGIDLYSWNSFLQENIKNVREYVSKWMEIKDQSDLHTQIPVQFRDYQQQWLKDLIKQKKDQKHDLQRLQTIYLALLDECLDRNIQQIFEIGILSKCDQKKFHLGQDYIYQCCKKKIKIELRKIINKGIRMQNRQIQDDVWRQYKQWLRRSEYSEIAQKYDYYKKQQIEQQLESIQVYKLQRAYMKQQLQTVTEFLENYNNQIINKNKTQDKKLNTSFNLESVIQRHSTRRGEWQNNSQQEQEGQEQENEQEQGNIDANELKVKTNKRNKEIALKQNNSRYYLQKFTPNKIIQASRLKNDLKNSKSEEMNYEL